jgi:hypothetical protein
MGMKNGLGQGDWIVDEEDVERIEGIRMTLADPDGVCASRLIGLKYISSVLMLSGDEQ